jgi:DNA-binding IclR family transcriptional regulator
VPAIARPPAAVPAERRDVAARNGLLLRIQCEFEEMPGLLLTLGQAARLFGLSPAIASRILERLSDACVLRQRSDGKFALRVDQS